MASLISWSSTGAGEAANSGVILPAVETNASSSGVNLPQVGDVSLSHPKLSAVTTATPASESDSEQLSDGTLLAAAIEAEGEMERENELDTMVRLGKEVEEERQAATVLGEALHAASQEHTAVRRLWVLRERLALRQNRMGAKPVGTQKSRKFLRKKKRKTEELMIPCRRTGAPGNRWALTQ